MRVPGHKTALSPLFLQRKKAERGRKGKGETEEKGRERGKGKEQRVEGNMRERKRELSVSDGNSQGAPSPPWFCFATEWLLQRHAAGIVPEGGGGK